MSFLTIFPEDVYPVSRLAETIRTDAFDIDTAQALMWLSQAAYETTADGTEAPGPTKLERLLERWGFACRARLSQGGTEGFVAESESALVVAFAGTDPVVAANWITNFDIRTGTDGIHRGFAEGVESVWPALAAALDGTSKPIFLAGHSLGGALAVVAGWHLTGDDQGLGGLGVPPERIAGLVTFGMPRVGDEAFAAAYKARGLWETTVRLEYGGDIVPTVPPAASGPLGFRHVGLVLRCPHGGQFADSLPPRDEPDDIRSPLEDMANRAGGEALRKWQEGWGRILNHGVPRSPAGGTATLLIDRLPFFFRDHLQDCYLEALGWSFARPSESRVAISADAADAFVQESEASIEASAGDLSGLLRRLFPGA